MWKIEPKIVAKFVEKLPYLRRMERPVIQKILAFPELWRPTVHTILHIFLKPHFCNTIPPPVHTNSVNPHTETESFLIHSPEWFNFYLIFILLASPKKQQQQNIQRN